MLIVMVKMCNFSNMYHPDLLLPGANVYFADFGDHGYERDDASNMTIMLTSQFVKWLRGGLGLLVSWSLGRDCCVACT